MTSTIRQSVLNLLAQGLTDSEIAARIGVSRNVVIGHRHRAGAAPNLSPKNPVKRKYPTWSSGIGCRDRAPHQHSSTCRWIDGDPRSGKWSYCGQPSTDVKSAWCKAHRKRVYCKSHITSAAALAKAEDTESLTNLAKGRRPTHGRLLDRKTA